MTKVITTKQKGFTLVELLVVIGIIAALAAVVIPNVSRFVGAGDDASNDTELQTVQASLDLFMAQEALTTITASGATATDEWESGVAGAIDLNGAGTAGGYLYPDFLRQAPTKCEYTWDVNGQVLTQVNCDD